jgi:hypothetical protein
MDCQTPYGTKCTLEACGIYSRLQCYIRIWAMTWLDIWAEIVSVIGCEEGKELSRAFLSMEGKPP